MTFGVDGKGGEGQDLFSGRRIGSVISEKFVDCSYREANDVMFCVDKEIV